MEQRTTFFVPEANYPRLEKEVAKLSRKAEKYEGWSFAPLIIGLEYRDNADGTRSRVFEVNLDVMPIRCGNWTFVARIDHSNETGNVVRVVPNCGHEVENRFRNTAPDCEHCNHKRKRRDTFVLRNDDTGEFKQVGSTCLNDFLGINAADLGRIAELAGYATEAARHCETAIEGSGIQDRRYVDLNTFLAYSACSVRNSGWISGSSAYTNPTLVSTKADAMNRMAVGEIPTDEDYAVATEALEWAQGFANLTDINDYQHNVLVIANASVIEARSCGIAASIVGVYCKNKARRNRVQINDMTALVLLFANVNPKLKYPKLVMQFEKSGSVEMYRAGDRSNAPGSINIKRPGYGGAWLGRIHLDGRFQTSANTPEGMGTDLVEFATNPADMASRHGHKTGSCCFCNKPLTDDRSVRVGYGKTCARNWNQPY
jgi:hypothetical protein